MTGTELLPDARARHRLAAALQHARSPRPPGPTSRRSACRRGARPIRRWRRRCRRSSARAKTGLSLTIPKELQGPVTDNRGGGSDDIGDISWNVPTVTLRYPANIPGLPGHNWANAIAMATPIAHKGATAGAKVQAMTMLDLLLQPGARARRPGTTSAPCRRRIRSTSRCSAPGDKPAIELNKGVDGPVPAGDAEVLLRSRPATRPISSSWGLRIRPSRRTDAGSRLRSSQVRNSARPAEPLERIWVRSRRAQLVAATSPSWCRAAAVRTRGSAESRTATA